MPPLRTGPIRPKGSSERTGFYMPCNGNGNLHGQIALPIFRGPKGWAYLWCPICKAKQFFGHEWKNEMGFERTAMIEAGFFVPH